MKCDGIYMGWQARVVRDERQLAERVGWWVSGG